MLSRLISPRWKFGRRQLIVAAVTLPLFAVIHYLAYWLRFDGQLASAQLDMIASYLGWVVLIKLTLFTWFRVYHGWNKYVTFHDLAAIVQASSASSVLLVLGDYLLLPGTIVPRSVFLMDWAMTIAAIGGIRSITRALDERATLGFLRTNREPVFIVGANDSGEALLRAIRRNPGLPYQVIGFIADDATIPCIGGVPVVGTLEQTCQLAKKHQVKEVLITAGDLSGRQVAKLVENARRQDVAVKVLPSYEQLLRGNVDLSPRRVSIEDLLRREPVQLDIQELNRWIGDRVLLVTGSAGSIGSEICRQLLQFRPKRLIALDRSENGQFFLERELRRTFANADIQICIADINDANRIQKIFDEHRPDIVFHAAAYKHVPLMEANPSEALKNIVLATRALADIANNSGVSSLVMISTDKAVNPTSIMGACKRAAELYVQALAKTSRCRFVTVRFGNVLDSAGSVVPVFREQIVTGGPVTVTHPDMRRFFMTIPEASQLVVQAGAMGKGGEIFVLDMGQPVRIVDLAKDMIRLSGLVVGEDIRIEYVGTRPGEKLYEELHCDGERHVTTSHPKIMVAECQKVELHALRDSFDRIDRFVDAPKEIIIRELANLIPQYRCSALPPGYSRAA